MSVTVFARAARSVELAVLAVVMTWWTVICIDSARGANTKSLGYIVVFAVVGPFVGVLALKRWEPRGWFIAFRRAGEFAVGSILLLLGLQWLIVAVAAPH